MGETSEPATIVGPAEAEAKPVDRARGATMSVLVGPQLSSPRFITRRFVLAPGGRIPTHRHDRIEHEQVVTRGAMQVVLDGTAHLVAAGDAVLIPAGCAHSYENLGAEPCEFVCVVPATPDYQTEWLEPPPEGAYRA